MHHNFNNFEIFKDISKDKIIFDMTFGRGNISKWFLNRGNRVLAMDVDVKTFENACSIKSQKFKFYTGPSHTFYKHFTTKCDIGIIDAGVSDYTLIKRTSFKNQDNKQNAIYIHDGRKMSVIDFINIANLSFLIRVIIKYSNMSKDHFKYVEKIKKQHWYSNHDLYRYLYKLKDGKNILHGLFFAIRNYLNRETDLLNLCIKTFFQHNVNAKIYLLLYNSFENKLIRDTCQKNDLKMKNNKISIKHNKMKSVKFFILSKK